MQINFNYSSKIDAKKCEKILKKITVKTFKKLNINQNFIIDIDLVNNRQIQKINQFMTAKSLAEIQKFVKEDSVGFKDLKQFWAYCQALSLTDFVVIDTAIVRGLAYYTGIVFECFDTAGKFRAIFGGGRYDHLFERLTGKPCQAVGLGFGDVVVEELYKDKFGSAETYEGVDVVLGGFGEAAEPELLKLVALMDEMNLTLDYDFKAVAPGKFLGRASKRGAKKALYIGENELAEGQVMVKNLETREQTFLKLNDVKGLKKALC